jgi:hypothetical protein
MLVAFFFMVLAAVQMFSSEAGINTTVPVLFGTLNAFDGGGNGGSGGDSGGGCCGGDPGGSTGGDPSGGGGSGNYDPTPPPPPPPPSPPGAPTGLIGQCDASGLVSVYWTPTPDATAYDVRINNQNNGFDCLSFSNSPDVLGDVCTGPYWGTNGYSYQGVPGATYSFWVYAVNSVSGYGPYTIGNTFTCPLPPPPKPVCTLDVTPGSIEKGQSATISWTSQNATSGSIDNGVGSISPVSSGSVSVSPNTDTTYTATFTGDGGTVTCLDSVTVKLPPPPKPYCTLDVHPYSITKGESATVSWTSSNATSGSIDNGIGSIGPVASGSVTVSPTSDTTYTATFTGPGGTVTCSDSIVVKQPTPKPYCTLKATPNTINKGEHVTLAWTSSNATSGSIDNGVGSISPVASGSVTVAPTQNTNYTATFSGPGGTVTCSDYVTVNVPQKPVCTLKAWPSEIKQGGSTKLSWTSQNVTSGSIDHGVGTITPVASGSVTVYPPYSKTYTATFTGPYGSVSCSTYVKVKSYTHSSYWSW